MTIGVFGPLVAREQRELVDARSGTVPASQNKVTVAFVSPSVADTRAEFVVIDDAGGAASASHNGEAAVTVLTKIRFGVRLSF